MDERAAFLCGWFEKILVGGECPASELILILGRLPLKFGQGWRRHAVISPEGPSAAEVALWAIERFAKEVRSNGPGRFIISAFTVAGRAMAELRLEIGEGASVTSYEDVEVSAPVPDVEDAHLRLMRDVMISAYRKSTHVGEA